MLERLQQRSGIPPLVAEKRVALLKQHQQQLYEQRSILDALLVAVQQKIEFYEQYHNDPLLNEEEKCKKELEKESCVQ